MRKPWVTFSLVMLCIVLYYAIPPEIEYKFLTSPLILTHTFEPIEYLKALLSGFFHMSFGHLYGNMLILILLGYAVEMKIGHKSMLGVLGASGAGALVAHIGSAPYSPLPFLGASGFCFGVMVAYVFLIHTNWFFKLLPILWMSIWLYVEWQSPNMGIAHYAHVGGGLGALLFCTHRRQKLIKPHV